MVPNPTPEQRAKGERRMWWIRLVLPVWIERFWLLVITGLVVWSLLEIDGTVEQVDQNVRTLRAETSERRNQTCELFERENRAAIDRLNRSYNYLSELSQPELIEPLNRAILSQIEQLELEARAKPPEFCLPPEVGLPDPPLPIPSRPPNLP